jgi:hypothetical protein
MTGNASDLNHVGEGTTTGTDGAHLRSANTILRELADAEVVLRAMVATRRVWPSLREICAVVHPQFCWAEVSTQRLRDGRTRAAQVLDMLQDLVVRGRLRYVLRDRGELDVLASLRFEMVQYIAPTVPETSTTADLLAEGSVIRQQVRADLERLAPTAAGMQRRLFASDAQAVPTAIDEDRP